MLHYHAPMENRAADIRSAFRESIQQFVEVVERVPSGAWDRPGLGEWSIRELVGHVVGVIDGAVADTGHAESMAAEGAAAYYVQAMSSPRVHEEVAERARTRAASFGDNPVEAARAVVARTLDVVDALDDAAPVTTTIGPVRLVDFLPTRVMEVVIHTMDIAEAAGLAVEPSHDALTATLALVSEIAVAHGDGVALAMELSGRRSLPEGFNVLG